MKTTRRARGGAAWRAALGATLAAVSAPTIVRADVAEPPAPPWIEPGQVPPPAWARSVAPKAGEPGQKGDLVLYEGPARTTARRGVTAPGADLPFYAARRGSGCTGPWWQVGALAWTCSDDAELSPAEASSSDPIAAADANPGTYSFVSREGADAYVSLESAVAGAPDRELEGGWGLAVVEQRDANGVRWAKTSHGLWIALADLAPARTSRFQGQVLEDGRLDVAWVVSDRADVFPVASAKGKPKASRARFELVHVSAEEGPFVQVGDGAWVLAKDLARPAAGEPPPEVVHPAERWIDVDPATQTLVAYEGRRPVFATLVSTGKPNETPTPRGTHRVWAKLLASTMGNAASGDAEARYSLEDVPFVQFFDNGVALHGTYWHGDFGHPRSHGCVNLSPLDARWLFAFSAPRVAAGWASALPTALDEGTVVRVK